MYWRLFFTILIEAPVLFFFYQERPKWHLLWVAILLSCATWPIGMYVFCNSNISIFWIELLITSSEILMLILLHWGTKVRAVLAGFCMNLMSFGIGMWWNSL
jgi:hypothetical protein